jgi:hypothetical protein
MRPPSPGVPVEDQRAIMGRIASALDAALGPSGILGDRCQRVDADPDWLNAIDGTESYFVYRTHPVLAHREWVVGMDGKMLREFLSEKIRPKFREGLDLLIASRDFSSLIVTNHDGQVYIARQR